MSEKRFTLNMMKKPSEIEMDGKMISKYDVVRLLNEQQSIIQSLQDLCGQSDYENAKLRIENDQLRQILKDIVGATDETYTKNTSMFKVTVVLDYEKYMEIRRCIE